MVTCRVTFEQRRCEDPGWVFQAGGRADTKGLRQEWVQQEGREGQSRKEERGRRGCTAAPFIMHTCSGNRSTCYSSFYPQRQRLWEMWGQGSYSCPEPPAPLRPHKSCSEGRPTEHPSFNEIKWSTFRPRTFGTSPLGPTSMFGTSSKEILSQSVSYLCSAISTSGETVPQFKEDSRGFSLPCLNHWRDAELPRWKHQGWTDGP